VLVRLGGATARLDDPDDCGRFSVAADAGVDAGAALAGQGLGGPVEGDPGHVWVAVDGVRRLAAGRVGDGWDERFDGMLAYARTKGWLDDTGSAIKGHVEPSAG
jgi:hypothetical protein